MVIEKVRTLVFIGTKQAILKDKKNKYEGEWIPTRATDVGHERLPCPLRPPRRYLSVDRNFKDIIFSLFRLNAALLWQNTALCNCATYSQYLVFIKALILLQDLWHKTQL